MGRRKKTNDINTYQAQKYIAKNIRFMRQLNNISQLEAAEIFGMSKTRYNVLESGEKPFDLTTVCMISDYYGVELGYFISFDISEHFMYELTSGTYESRTSQFASGYLRLSYGSRQKVCRLISDIISKEELYNHLAWRYDGHE